MYTKDKSNRITLRLNDEQFEFVKQNADFLGVSRSEFLRMVVNASMPMIKIALSKIETGEVIDTPSSRVKAPSWYDVHPQSDYVYLDPDEGLPL